MKLIKCECCGGNQFQKKTGNSMVCAFCGSVYRMDENENIMSKELTDAKILALYVKAEEFRQNNDPIESLQKLTEALGVDEGRPLSWVKLGRAYRECGAMNDSYMDKAVGCYEKAIELDPYFPTAYTNIATVYLIRKQYADAIRYFEKGLPLFDEKDVEYPTVLANYGVALGLGGDKNEAGRILDKAERLGYEKMDQAREIVGL